MGPRFMSEDSHCSITYNKKSGSNQMSSDRGTDKELRYGYTMQDYAAIQIMFLKNS